MSDKELMGYFKNWWSQEAENAQNAFYESDPRARGNVTTKHPNDESLEEIVNFYKGYMNQFGN